MRGAPSSSTSTCARSQPHVFAIGDVNGGPQFTYISLDDSRIVADQLLGDGRRTVADRVAVPQTVFMTPPLSTVGITEREAVEQGTGFWSQPSRSRRSSGCRARRSSGRPGA